MTQSRTKIVSLSFGFILFVSVPVYEGEQKPKIRFADKQVLEKFATAFASPVNAPAVDQNRFFSKLDALQNVREGRLHWKSLDAVYDTDEDAMLSDAAAYLQKSWETDDFDENDENIRMKIVDYVGEKLRGRLWIRSKDLVEKLAFAILRLNVLEGRFDEAKKKSLLGDKIEVVQYLAFSDSSRAENIVAFHPFSQERKLLAMALENAQFVR